MTPSAKAVALAALLCTAFAAQANGRVLHQIEKRGPLISYSVTNGKTFDHDYELSVQTVRKTDPETGEITMDRGVAEASSTVIGFKPEADVFTAVNIKSDGSLRSRSEASAMAEVPFRLTTRANTTAFSSAALFRRNDEGILVTSDATAQADASKDFDTVLSVSTAKSNARAFERDGLLLSQASEATFANNIFTFLTPGTGESLSAGESGNNRVDITRAEYIRLVENGELP